MPSVVCNWKGWGRHLVSLVLPDAVTLPVAPLQDPAELLANAISDGVPDVIVIHIDSTFPGQIFPGVSEFAELAARGGIPVWNHRVQDISKRTIQTHITGRGWQSTRADKAGPGSERLIVKTNLNHHGVIESRVTADERLVLGWAPYAKTPINPWPDYPVICRLDIPNSWWTDPRLHIERYVTNSENGLYRMYFAGENCILRVGTSDEPVLRLADSDHYRSYLLLREMADDPISALLLDSRASAVFRCATRFARSFGVDYGTVDLVATDNNDSYVVDFNACPFWGADDGDDDAQFVVGHLAAGFARPAAPWLTSVTDR